MIHGTHRQMGQAPHPPPFLPLPLPSAASESLGWRHAKQKAWEQGRTAASISRPAHSAQLSSGRISFIRTASLLVPLVLVLLLGLADVAVAVAAAARAWALPTSSCRERRWAVTCRVRCCWCVLECGIDVCDGHVDDWTG